MHKARQERAEIMEKAKKNAQKEKKTNLSNFNPTSAGKKEPIYYSSSNMEGTGLWCQQIPSKIPEKPEIIQLPEFPALTNDLELKLSKDMATILEKKCSDLGKQLDLEIFSKQQQDTKIKTLEQRLQDSQIEISDLREHIKTLQAQKNDLENAMDENCIHYNYSQNQTISLQKEVENEKERAEAYRKLYEEELKLKDEENDEYTNEINYLKQSIEGINEENNGLKEYLAHLQKENEKLVEEREQLGQRYVQEVNSSQTKEEKAKAKTTKINLLNAENKALQAKIKELEDNRKKTQEVLKKKDEEVKSERYEIDSLKKRIKLEQEMRKHQIDLVAQRDSRLKILEERFGKLEQQYNALLKATQPEYEEKPRAKLVKVQPNPSLFND